MTDKLSDEDKALFRKAVVNVKPLTQRKKIDSIETKPIRQPLANRNQELLESGTNYNLSNHYEHPVNSESILTYAKPGIPRKQLLQLKTGHIPYQTKMDLHGFRPDEAQDKLCKFIEQQYLLHHRCVLIIHGKGSLHGEPPVLKNLVNHWLKQLPQILAFHSALPRDGGAGAMYVLLKRQRL